MCPATHWQKPQGERSTPVTPRCLACRAAVIWGMSLPPLATVMPHDNQPQDLSRTQQQMLIPPMSGVAGQMALPGLAASLLDVGLSLLSADLGETGRCSMCLSPSPRVGWSPSNGNLRGARAQAEILFTPLPVSYPLTFHWPKKKKNHIHTESRIVEICFDVRSCSHMVKGGVWNGAINTHCPPYYVLHIQGGSLSTQTMN